MSNLSEDQRSEFTATLQARAKALGGEVDEVERDRAESLSTAQDTVEDSGDEAEDRRADEVRNGEEERDTQELRAIDAALARLKEGSYGECIDCDRDIPLARLKAQPTAARCIECQEKYEKTHPGM